MRLVSWLDQLSARRSPQNRGRLRRRWPMAEVELLEDRTQLTPPFVATGSGDLIGDTPATALDLGPLTATGPLKFFGAIDFFADVDVFRFQAGSDGSATIQLSADFSALDTILTLLDSSGNFLASDDDSGFGSDSLLTYTVRRGELFFVEAEGFGSK